MDKKNSTKTTN